MWESTVFPNIFHVIWSSDSPFQLAKPLSDHLAELQGNGMVLEGGKDIEDGPPTQKSIFKVGAYIMVSDDTPTVLTVVVKPETPEEAAAKAKLIADNVHRTTARTKLVALGLTREEADSLRL